MKKRMTVSASASLMNVVFMHDHTYEKVVDSIGLYDPPDDVLDAIEFIFDHYSEVEENRKDAIAFMIEDFKGIWTNLSTNGYGFFVNDDEPTDRIETIFIAALCNEHFKSNVLPSKGLWYEDAYTTWAEMRLLEQRYKLYGHDPEYDALRDISPDAHLLLLVLKQDEMEHFLRRVQTPNSFTEEETQQQFIDQSYPDVSPALLRNGDIVTLTIKGLSSAIFTAVERLQSTAPQPEHD